MKYHYTCIKISKIKNNDGMKQLELSCTAGRNGKWNNHKTTVLLNQNSSTISQKIKHTSNIPHEQQMFW